MIIKENLKRKEKFVTHKRIRNGEVSHLKVDGFVINRLSLLNDLDNASYFIFINGKKLKKLLRCGDFISIIDNDVKDNFGDLPTF